VLDVFDFLTAQPTGRATPDADGSCSSAGDSDYAAGSGAEQARQRSTAGGCSYQGGCSRRPGDVNANLKIIKNVEETLL
jgi:hypothetical protein